MKPNDRISEYILEQKIGGGAYGEVWRARHHVWADQLVAIKIPTDSAYVRHLQQEGAAIHGLIHPNIVRAMGFDPYADPPYLTMEYVPGTSLRPLIKDKKLTPADAVAIMRQVLAGLKYAHERGLIHRDLKPENILVHERAQRDGLGVEGVIKIADFGLGKASTAVNAAAAANSIAFSGSINDAAGREIAGTLEYMAPEQRGGAAIDQRADLYACGVVLYELLTGEKPAGTEVPSDLNPRSPRSLDEVFRRSYARLEKRFASADEFAQALSAALPPPLPAPAQSQSPSSPPPIPSKTLPPVQLKPALIRAGAGVCPQCRKPVDANDQFCMHCGIQLVSAIRRCQRCGAYPDRSDRFCIFCGETLAAMS
jgi:serine/threonine protein kinase